MAVNRDLKTLLSELRKGMALSKCRKCGCMKGALEELRENLADDPAGDSAALCKKVQTWLDRTGESLYT
jgi:hypothetical protein